MLINIRLILFVVSLCIFSNNLFAQNYKKIHDKAIVVDTHNDILSTAIEKGYSFDQDLTGKTHSDLQRMEKGGIDVQFFSVWCDGKKQNPFAWANTEIDTLDAWVSRHHDKMMIAKTSCELMRAVKEHKLASMIGVEGGHMIENDLSKLDSLFKRGVRYMILTWNNSTSWATSAMEETHDSLLHQPKGLNDFGKQVIRRMNELGMLIDLSHVGEQTFWDAINTTTKPVIVSHSCAYALNPVFRNLKDEQIKAVGKNGGVIHLNFYSGFLDSNYNRRKETFLKAHAAERDSLVKAKFVGYEIDEWMSKKYPAEVASL